MDTKINLDRFLIDTFTDKPAWRQYFNAVQAGLSDYPFFNIDWVTHIPAPRCGSDVQYTLQGAPDSIMSTDGYWISGTKLWKKEGTNFTEICDICGNFIKEYEGDKTLNSLDRIAMFNQFIADKALGVGVHACILDDLGNYNVYVSVAAADDKATGKLYPLKSSVGVDFYNAANTYGMRKWQRHEPMDSWVMLNRLKHYARTLYGTDPLVVYHSDDLCITEPAFVEATNTTSFTVYRKDATDIVSSEGLSVWYTLDNGIVGQYQLNDSNIDRHAGFLHPVIDVQCLAWDIHIKDDNNRARVVSYTVVEDGASNHSLSNVYECNFPQIAKYAQARLFCGSTGVTSIVGGYAVMQGADASAMYSGRIVASNNHAICVVPEALPSYTWNASDILTQIGDKKTASESTFTTAQSAYTTARGNFSKACLKKIDDEAVLLGTELDEGLKEDVASCLSNVYSRLHCSPYSTVISEADLTISASNRGSVSLSLKEGDIITFYGRSFRSPYPSDYPASVPFSTAEPGYTSTPHVHSLVDNASLTFDIDLSVPFSLTISNQRNISSGSIALTLSALVSAYKAYVAAAEDYKYWCDLYAHIEQYGARMDAIVHPGGSSPSSSWLTDQEFTIKYLVLPQSPVEFALRFNEGVDTKIVSDFNWFLEQCIEVADRANASAFGGDGKSKVGETPEPTPEDEWYTLSIIYDDTICSVFIDGKVYDITNPPQFRAGDSTLIEIRVTNPAYTFVGWLINGTLQSAETRFTLKIYRDTVMYASVVDISSYIKCKYVAGGQPFQVRAWGYGNSEPAADDFALSAGPLTGIWSKDENRRVDDLSTNIRVVLKDDLFFADTVDVGDTGEPGTSSYYGEYPFLGSSGDHELRVVTNGRIDTDKVVFDHAFRDSAIYEIDFDFTDCTNWSTRHMFDGASHLTRATIPSTTADAYSFFGTNIPCVDSGTDPTQPGAHMPNLTTIGESAFANSAAVTADLPNVVSIDKAAFSRCRLTTVDAPVCTSIQSELFYAVSTLYHAYFPLIPSVPASTFSGCSNLTELDVHSATIIGASAFSGCSNLTSLVSGELPFGDITRVGDSSFAGCSGLTRIYLPDVVDEVVSGKTVYGVGAGAFTGCTGVSTVSQTTDVASVYIPQITGLPARTFEGCRLEEVDMPYVLTVGDSCFKNNIILASVSTPACTYYGKSAFMGDLYLSSVDAPALVTAAESCFEGCSRLLDVELESLATADTRCFANAGLKSVTLPALTTAGDEAFLNCKDLYYVDTPAIETAGDSCFKGCYVSTSDVFLANFQSLTTIGDSCFEDCVELKEFDAPALTTAGNEAFMKCTGLHSVDAPSLTTVGTNAFAGCFSGPADSYSANLPSLATMGSGAFSGCLYLDTLHLPSATSLPASCFAASGIVKVTTDETAVETPGWVTLPAVENTIPQLCFADCLSLTHAYLPRITALSNSAFTGCRSFVCFTTEDPLTLDVFSSGVYAPDITSLPANAFKDNDHLQCAIASGITQFGSYCFSNTAIATIAQDVCPEVTSTSKFVYIPDVTEISVGMFADDIWLANGKLTKVTTLRTRCFAGSQYCWAVSNVDETVVTRDPEHPTEYTEVETLYIPAVTTIEASAFENCTGIQVFTHTEITSLGHHALYECNKLLEVHLPKVPAIDSDMFQWTNNEFALLDIAIDAPYNATANGYVVGGHTFTTKTPMGDYWRYTID